MAKATIISVFPFEINEFKPGLVKGSFKIPAAKGDTVQLLVINDSNFNQGLAGTDRTISVPVYAKDIAKSLVEDFCFSHVCAKRAETEDDLPAHAGLMWIDGEVSLAEIVVKYKKEIERLRKIQENWYIELVKTADSDFATYKNVGVITEHQRHAAKELQLERPWLIDYNPTAGLVKCGGCQTLISPEAIKCAHCGFIVNVTKYEQNKARFA